MKKKVKKQTNKETGICQAERSEREKVKVK